MTTHYADRFEEMMSTSYGPFWPGSTARDLRTENARRGYRTCWNPSCLRAFRPERVVGSDGKLHRLGRGRWFCSAKRARAARVAAALPMNLELDGDEFTIDFGGCKGCAA